jgi:2-amino-4-hydroxy-6-hydroxymethyldihydropteridine diphosphokinase
MSRVFLGLGSNVGDRLGYLRTAVGRLRAVEPLRIIAVSPVYETEPVGKKDQREFLNLVLGCESDCDPRNLAAIVREIERLVGRTPGGQWGPREIDIDILYTGDSVVTSIPVRIPHPRARHRKFVLVPMCDISPSFPDPLTGKRMIDLLRECPGEERIRKSEETL